MHYYKVKIRRITTGNGIMTLYGNSTQGFPAMVARTDTGDWGVCITEEPLETSDKVVEITEAEFETRVGEINTVNLALQEEEKKKALASSDKIQELEMLIAELALSQGGAL